LQNGHFAGEFFLLVISHLQQIISQKNFGSQEWFSCIKEILSLSSIVGEEKEV
jgi:hypothetical protein